MKKIYRLRLCQKFNTINVLLPFLKSKDEILGEIEFIYASNKQEAMDIYDRLHPINKECLLNDCYNAIHFPKVLNKKNPDFKYSFYINEPTIDELKVYMSSNKFIEYCAKEMYDIFREEYLKDLQKEEMERRYSNEQNIQSDIDARIQCT